MTKLTAKQQRFCDEYLIDLNATQAAIKAETWSSRIEFCNKAALLIQGGFFRAEE